MALKSMTAYGSGEVESAGLTYVCEVRSLNSRYLEVSARVPRHLLALEIEVTNHVKSRLRRGKVDVFVDVARAGGLRDMPELDDAAARHYLRLLKHLGELAADVGLAPSAPVKAPDLSLTELLRLDGVLMTGGKERGQGVAEPHREALFQALEGAIEQALAARAKEGEALGEAMASLLKDLEQGRQAVAKLRDTIIPALQRTYQKRLEAALEMLQKSGKATAQIPEERLLAEVAVQSDKADIDEELTRLKTHIGEFRRLMGEDDSPGRKLDFLCQEMHREVNTMSNKLVQTEVSQHTLEMKQIIERLRQQVQNIE